MTKIPLSKPIMSRQMISAMLDAAAQPNLVSGEQVQKFEEEFAKYIGVDYAVAVNSGTFALQSALLAMSKDAPGIKKKIIVPSFTFIASANACKYANCDVIFSDVNYDFTTDFDHAIFKDKTFDNKFAIMPVHLFGLPCNMERAREIADDKNMFIIEDACQAHGAVYKGKRCGSLGDIGAFSFYVTKNLHCGMDGGMVTTNNKKWADYVKLIRNQAKGPINGQYDEYGYTGRMCTIPAAIGREHLKILDDCNSKRYYAAVRYNYYLSDITNIKLPTIRDTNRVSCCHVYAIQSPNAIKIVNELLKNEVECRLVFPIPIHKQKNYLTTGPQQYKYPRAEWLAEHTVMLPMCPDITDKEIKFITEIIKEVSA